MTAADGTVRRLTARRAVVLATGSRASLPPVDGLADIRAWDKTLRPARAQRRCCVMRRGGRVRDAIVPAGAGVALIRLLRRWPGSATAYADGVVEHALRLGGFDTSFVRWSTDGVTATGAISGRGQVRSVRVHGGHHETRGELLLTRMKVSAQDWTALVIGVDSDVDADAERLLAQMRRQDSRAEASLRDGELPSSHPRRALDALAVIRACTSRASGAVVASPTTSLPEAPGGDRQFDYRYTWLRGASLSTTVATLLGKGSEARRY